jgi:tripartite-type tricarboxylate transporter receptor subunit TctC
VSSAKSCRYGQSISQGLIHRIRWCVRLSRFLHWLNTKTGAEARSQIGKGDIGGRMIKTIGIFGAVVALSAGLWLDPASGAYPEKPVKVVVPAAPGGPADVMARLIAQKLSEHLKQQFYVDNRPGAGGNIGTMTVAKANPDGYTLLLTTSSYVVNPSLYANNPFDPFKDFEPIIRAAASPNIFVVHPSVPATTMKELVELIHANPGKYSMGNPGLGTTPQLAGELAKLSLKLDVISVPFGGAGPAIQSTVGGHTPIAVSALPPATPQVKGNLLRALAVTSATRSAAFPDIPTMAEAGIAGQESETMQGIFAPAGTPTAIINFLNAEIAKIMSLPEIKAKCAELGFEPIGDTPAEFAAYIRTEVEKWDRVIKDAKIEQIK